MNRQIFPIILLFLVSAIQGVRALEPYTTLSSDNKTLTFYYDNQIEVRGGATFNIKNWKNQRESITTVVFDDSFADYTFFTSTADWFNGFENLTSIIGLEKLNTTNVIHMTNMFNYCRSLTSLDVSHFNTANVKDMANMFADCSALTSIDVSNFNTANVEDMSYMFNYCQSLTSLDVSNFNTANVKKMNGMFAHCSALTSLDVSNFNTANVTFMSSMFEYCNALTSLDVSNFNTAKVQVISSMFFNCQSLTSLDVSNFNTANVITMNGMFDDCKGLTSLDVSNFNTANVTDMAYMFYGCNALASLDVSKFNTAKVEDMSHMFQNCSALTTIYCNDTWSCGKSFQMFSACESIKGAIAYNATKTDVTYANPDTGYFTRTNETYVPTLNATDGRQNNEACYSLSGQRLATPLKGINIIDNKKVVVK